DQVRVQFSRVVRVVSRQAPSLVPIRPAILSPRLSPGSSQALGPNRRDEFGWSAPLPKCFAEGIYVAGDIHCRESTELFGTRPTQRASYTPSPWWSPVGSLRRRVSVLTQRTHRTQKAAEKQEQQGYPSRLSSASISVHSGAYSCSKVAQLLAGALY